MKLLLENWREYSSKIISERNNVDTNLKGGAEWKWAESAASEGWDTGFRTARGSEYIFDGDTQTSLRNRSIKGHHDKSVGVQDPMPCVFMKDQRSTVSAVWALEKIQSWNENFKVSSYEVVDVRFTISADEIESLIKDKEYSYLAPNGPRWKKYYNIAKQHAPSYARYIQKNQMDFNSIQIFTFPILFPQVYGEKTITILLKIKNGGNTGWVISEWFSYDSDSPKMGYLPFEFRKSNSKIVQVHAGNKITKIVSL
jgi:hypothetical protein